jgi:hypothetical protein
MTSPNPPASHVADLSEIEERRFYELGPVFGSPPPLFRARQPQGKATHAAVVALLDHIEARGSHEKEVRAILAACQAGTDHAIKPSALLFGMPDKLLGDVLRIFSWVAATGGLSLDDFEDGGERLLRAVHRKPAKATTARTAKGGT